MRRHSNSDHLTCDANTDRDCLLSVAAAVSNADRYIGFANLADSVSDSEIT